MRKVLEDWAEANEEGNEGFYNPKLANPDHDPDPGLTETTTAVLLLVERLDTMNMVLMDIRNALEVLADGKR